MLSLLLCMSCSDHEQQQEMPGTALDSAALRELLVDSLILDTSNLFRWEVGRDTMFIHSLNATMFQVVTPSGMDDTEYAVVRDNVTKQLFTIELPGWPTMGMRPSNKLQLLLLTDDEMIEPINYDYQGLEAFLNQCAALRSAPMALSALDSIIEYCFESPMPRVTSAAEMRETLRTPINGEFPINEAWADSMGNALEHKMNMGNVLLYRVTPGMLYYVEVNPISNAEISAEYQTYRRDNYWKEVKGNYYNIRMFQIFYHEYDRKF